MGGGLGEGGGGHESNDFAAGDGDSEFGCFVLDGRKDGVERGDFKIGEVHRDLGHAAGMEHHAHRFDVRQATRGCADAAGDLFSDGKVSGLEVDVVGQQVFAGADDCCSGSWVKRGTTEVRVTGRIGKNGLAEGFKATLANDFEAFALGTEGGGFVEVDGNLQLCPNALTELMGKDGALVERDALDGDQGNHVGGANAGVDAVMGVEIDGLTGDLNGAKGSLKDGIGVAGKGEDGAMMIDIAFLREEFGAGGGGDRLGNPLDDDGVAACTEIRYAFYEGLCQERSPRRYTMAPFLKTARTRFSPR